MLGKRYVRYYDIYVTCFLLLLYAIVLVKTNSWIGGFAKSMFEPGPTFFPLFISGFSLALSLLLLGRQISALRQGLPDPTYVEEEDAPTHFILIACFIIAVMYTYLLQVIGFILSSLLFVPAIQIALGNRDIKKMIFFSLGALIVAYLFFIQLLSVIMPRGIGIFKTFSMLFY